MAERPCVLVPAVLSASTNPASAAKEEATRLQALNDISSDESNEVVFVVPLEVLRAVEEVD